MKQTSFWLVSGAPIWVGLLVALALFACTPILCAQTAGIVTVRVSDLADESPIDQAEVKLLSFGHMSASYWAFTDGGGHLSFQAVQRGSYRVEAKKAGYDLGVEQVDVAPGQSHVVLVRLRLTPPKNSGPSPTLGTVSARDAAIPSAARKEYDAGTARLASDPSGGITHFRKAIEQYPKYADAHLMMAIAFLKLNRPDDAAISVDKAIEVDPKFGRAYVLRGRLLLERSDFGKAEAALNESLRLDPKAWDTHFQLARCYYNTDRIDLALEQAREARDLPDSSPITHLLLADIYLKQDQKKEAIAELEAFAKAEPASSMLPRIQQKIAKLRAQP